MPPLKKAKQIRSSVNIRTTHRIYPRLLKYRTKLEKVVGAPVSWAQTVEVLLNKARVK